MNKSGSWIAQMVAFKEAPNQAPVVNAGPNQTITLPMNTVTLNGTVTDDGLPNNTLTISWSQVSGPTGVTFSSPNTAVTQATFPGAGTYVLQLTANDSQLSTSATVTVTVNPANQPPVVNAGPNQTIPAKCCDLEWQRYGQQHPHNHLGYRVRPGPRAIHKPNKPDDQCGLRGTRCLRSEPLREQPARHR